MPNTFAFLVLFSYPLVTIILFRRLGLQKALIWSILGGYLFLPEGTVVDFPLLPPLSKDSIPSLTAAVMCWLAARSSPPRPPVLLNSRELHMFHGPSIVSSQRSPSRQIKLANLCILLLFISPVFTALTNTDWLFFGPRVIQGLRAYDGFSMMLDAFVMLLPFMLARRYLTTDKALMTLLWALVISALVYSMLMLIEIRLSPQLHRWVYGFHAHDFGQQMRNDGFRPTVFIQHGLRVALFILIALLAALTLYQIGQARQKVGSALGGDSSNERPDKGLPLYLAVYLFLMLLLSKSLGVLLIACVLVPIMLLAKPKNWRFFAASITFMVLLFPLARSAGIVPVDQIYSFALSIDEERASSLLFRLENEDQLLERASGRSLFGWGGWGRNLIYDPINGSDQSVTDGAWVIFFGVYGWVGYLARFGLLTLPVFAYFLTRGPLRSSIASQGLCLILAANLIDLIPNSGLTPVTWMIAGSLLGRFERRPREVKVGAQHRSRPLPERTRYQTARRPLQEIKTKSD